MIRIRVPALAAAVLASVCCAFSAGAVAADFDNQTTPFSVTIRGNEIAFRKFFLTALPGETVAFKTSVAAEVIVTHGDLISNPGTNHRWKAPNITGAYPINLITSSGERISLTAFVLVPYDRLQEGRINGYRIDAYPSKPLKGLSIYLPPRGFIEVTEENRDTPVSPHFTLGQFVSKQNSGYPKYVVLRPQMFLKLEGLLAEVNARGIRADSFHIMSGYRTPFYNRVIRNVDYSRHLWGGAADIFIDVAPADGVMDDINGDGVIDRKDAAFLFDIAEAYSRSSGRDLIGGLGEYDANAVHGPFVHIDARGYRARWGRR